jgi:hypothetical protein
MKKPSALYEVEYQVPELESRLVYMPLAWRTTHKRPLDALFEEVIRPVAFAVHQGCVEVIPRDSKVVAFSMTPIDVEHGRGVTRRFDLRWISTRFATHHVVAMSVHGPGVDFAEHSAVIEVQFSHGGVLTSLDPREVLIDAISTTEKHLGRLSEAARRIEAEGKN